MIVLLKALLFNELINGVLLGIISSCRRDTYNIRKQQELYARCAMDLTADPCEDFPKYACGNWEFCVNIPPENLSYNVIDAMKDEIYRSLNKTLFNKEFFQKYKEEDIIFQAKAYYDSCMNVKLIMSRGIQPLVQLIKSFGNCPALNPYWKPSSADWVHLIAHLRLFDENYLIGSLIDVDFRNSSTRIVYIGQPNLGNEDMNGSDKQSYLEEYKHNLEKTILELGGENLVAKRVSQEILDLEARLQGISRNVTKRADRAELYNRATIPDLNILYPLIDWGKYLSILYERPVDESEEFLFETLYLGQLMTILASTKPEIIYNYVLINFSLAKRALVMTNVDTTQKESRWKACVENVIDNMPLAAGHIFVRKLFKRRKLNDVNDIISNIKNKFKEVLYNTTWMDDSTKKNAIKKLQLITVKVGLPEFLKHRSGRKQIFGNFRIKKDQFFESSLQLIRINNAIDFTIFPSINSTSSIDLTEVNAQYDIGKNQVIIPAGLLQLPLYHWNLPQFQKYGIIGSIIAHELVHGFDNVGRNYDHKGEVNNWWTEKSLKEYINRSDCFVNQYDGLMVNGNHTLSENIADNVGIKVAFLAYLDLLKANIGNPVSRRERISGLKLTKEQLFFINFAQWRCKENTFEYNMLDPNDPHPPQDARVIGTLSNSKDFAKHFNCLKGAKMNPLNKCVLW